MLLHYFGEELAEPCGRCDLGLARKARAQRSEEDLETRLKSFLEQLEVTSLTLQTLAKRLEVKPKALLPILQQLLETDDRYRTDGVHLYKNK